jgi:DNA-binding HxlR family transcriptional regulator
VEYDLTDLGRSLEPLLLTMRGWGERYQAQAVNRNAQAPNPRHLAPSGETPF